jgi:hemerythrin-like metal-binding protein
MNERPNFTDAFLVGVGQVDREHRQLFEIAGRVYDHLNDPGEAAFAAARAAVGELIRYTETHFASEEAQMEAAGYPELAAHKELHHHLLVQVRDMEMRVELGERYVPVELSHFLYNWLLQHIQTEDKKFGRFAAGKGLAN